MRRFESRGFSLVELAITILVMGLILAFTVPALQGLNASQQLKGTSENISGQFRLAREGAIATGTTQVLHFQAGAFGCDYHSHNGISGPLRGQWKLPTGISYYWPAGTWWEYRWTKDGRCMDSGLIILQDRRGNRDTVSIQASGLVTHY